MTDTRRAVRSVVTTVRPSLPAVFLKIVASLALAEIVALVPQYSGLNEGARWALFILVLAAGLWVTEAIPAFAVGLLVIGLEILILGRPGGIFAKNPNDWERFIGVWGSPLIWLFFGGFVLAAAAEKTGLVNRMARQIILRTGTRPEMLLLSCMIISFTFSMFISNTAAATMMVALLAPLLAPISEEVRFRKGMLLGIAFSANLGGMGTLIGSPPNAIAAGALSGVDPVDFSKWMVAGLPPAVLLLLMAWAYLMMRYRSNSRTICLLATAIPQTANKVPHWNRVAVVIVFCTTILLWLTSAWHGVPATVISFLPICLLTGLGVLDATDIRKMQWDVLLLIAGGLALGVGVTDTGLATWLLAMLPISDWNAIGVAFAFAYFVAILSNLMSNTAAANIVIPIAIIAAQGFESQIVVSIALAASSAMCLPISTPPNAIAYGTGRLETKDLLQGGILIGLVAPVLSILWCWYIL